jgi:protein O-mannosyl-transferase
MKKASRKSAGNQAPRGALPSPAGEPRYSATLLTCLSLALCIATIAVYFSMYRSDFVAYDDDVYVTGNPAVQGGLTAQAVGWAFTTFSCSNWHPLTWLSHMADWQAFGANAGGHHLVSVGFHLANTLLVFTAFVMVTGRPWRSAIVAGIFAVHPLHVESVAWIAERKDVLSTFFGLLALVFYIRYARAQSRWRYALVVAAFALGLAAKPMLVTLPCVFLLVDLWPLKRLPWPPDWATLKHLVWEKTPLFALSAAASVVTFVAQRAGGAVAELASVSLPDRLQNALVAYAAYLGKAFWPSNLGVFYPSHPHATWSAPAALVLLLAATLAAFAFARSRPYLLAGWLWFLGMLVPVIGLVQVGAQAMADRYMYLPLVGLSAAIVWLASDAVETVKGARIAVAVTAFAVLIALGAAAHKQAGYWQSSQTLFKHTLAVTEGNYLMHNNLGAVLEREGRHDEAKAHYLQALKYLPDYADAHKNLAIILEAEGKRDEAMAHYEAAIASRPDYAQAHNNLGTILADLGRHDEAIMHYRQALVSRPDYANAHANLGHELLVLGQTDEAYTHLVRAVALKPQLITAQADLGILLADRGRYEEARQHLEAYLAASPGQPEIESKLGFVLTRLGRVDDAITLCQDAVRRNPGSAEARGNLSAALAAQQRLRQLGMPTNR